MIFIVHLRNFKNVHFTAGVGPWPQEPMEKGNKTDRHHWQIHFLEEETMEQNTTETPPRSDLSSKNPATGVGVGIGAAFVTLFAVLCCAGIPAILSFVGAIGLGVLIKKHLLFPLMVGSLLLGGWGAWRSYRSHRNGSFLAGYLLTALAIPLGMKFYHPAMYAGLVGLLILTGTDLVRKFRQPAVCVPEGAHIERDKTDGGCP